MNREVSASFQAVEDWLRSLGLLHYAQRFYDNGYEDIETCKLMKEQDLDVIDIKNDQDRTDILSAINKLQQNLYFELEPESTENITERTKIESVVLKSKLKECLENEKIQLTEPPYYNTDGTVGDLYPLAIRYAAELTTFFDDVLEALEQLRKRQLPTQNYDIMATEENESPLKRDQENRRSLRNVSNPAEYLNCETPGCKRSASFSKYDTRVTKSTTDLTKDNINTSGGSGGSPKSKSKKTKGFLGSVFKRTGTTRSVYTTLKPPSNQDFKASELQLSQDEIKNIFHQVKNKEITQEDALDVIKRRGLTKSTSYDGSPECTHQPLSERSSFSHITKETSMLGKIKSKSMKDPLRNRCASAQFYTKDDDISQSSTSLVSNGSKSSLEISGDHTGSAVDEDSSSVGSKNSPEINRQSAGIFKKIRNSMRKKKLNEGESPTEEKEAFLQNGACSPEENAIKEEGILIKSTHDTDNLFLTPINCNDIELSQHRLLHPNLSPQTTVIFPPPPTTPPPPPPVQYMSEETQTEDIAFRERTPSLKIKSYPMNQEEISKRRALEKNNNIPKNEININFENNSGTSSSATSNIESERYLLNSPSKCNQVEFITELNKAIPKVPPRPAPRRPSEDSMEPLPTVPPRRSKIFRTDSTDRQMDKLVQEMDDIKVDLDNHLQNVSSIDDNNKSEPNKTEIKKADSKKTKRPEPPIKTSTLGWKKPVPPPRPNISGAEDSSSVGSDTSSIGSRSPSISKDTWSPEINKKGKKKVSDMVTNKQWISKKLNREVINLSLRPYTSKNGCWCIPYNLVMRYADELTLPLQEIIKCFEEIRVDERKRMHQLFVPYTEKDLGMEKKCIHQTVDEYLVHIGLPMYVEDFREIGVKNVSEINNLDECDIRRIGIFDSNHATWFLKHAKSI